MIPGGLVRALGLGVDILEIRAEREQLVLNFNGNIAQMGQLNAIQLSADAERLLRRIDPRAVHLEIVIDSENVLSREVRVPRAAASELAGVLSFEIERHTPYRGDEVLFAHAILPASSDEDHLGIALDIVPKETIGKIFQPLKDKGYQLNAVRVSNQRIDLGVTDTGAGGVALKRMSIAAAALLIIVLISPLIRFQVSASAIRAEIEQARVQSAASQALKGNVESLQNRARAIAEVKAASPSMIEIFETLARLLPDGTWLQSINLIDGEIVIEGSTNSSSVLVSLLESSPLFQSVNYVSPIVRSRGGAIERFSFSLQLTRAGS